MGIFLDRATDLPTVGEVMTPNPLVIFEDLLARDAARLLEFYGVSGAPVVDGDGGVIGVLSLSDLMHALTTAPLLDAWPAFIARDLMSTPPITVHSAARVDEAARLMEAHRIHRLIVIHVNSRAPIGVVTATDLVRELAGGDE